jgi:hypothetical protein
VGTSISMNFYDRIGAFGGRHYAAPLDKGKDIEASDRRRRKRRRLRSRHEL